MNHNTYPSICIDVKAILEKISNIILQILEHRVPLPLDRLKSHLDALYISFAASKYPKLKPKQKKNFI